ncbi:MAG: type II toxin-antitoxin system ParD family antitoxin [Pseudomonadales bacterium]
MANVSLGKHYETYVQRLLETGRYNTTSEVIRDGLRLLEEQQQEKQLHLEKLRAEIQKGIDSGSDGDMDIHQIKQEAKVRLAQEQKWA